MNFNKFITKDGEVLIDFTASTVTPDTLLEGRVAINKDGHLIYGKKLGQSGGIKDVAELPMENIDTEAVYRITEEAKKEPEIYLYIQSQSTAYTMEEFLTMMASQQFPNASVSIAVFEVDELPEIMKPTILSETVIDYNVYILKSNGYIYVSETGSSADAIESSTNGYIDDISMATEQGYYVVRGENYTNYYYWRYVNNNWTEVAPMIDVTELPTSNIISNICYRLTPQGEINMYIMRNGELMDYNTMAAAQGLTVEYIIIDALPETPPTEVSETKLYVVKDTGESFIAAGESGFVSVASVLGVSVKGWTSDPTTITEDGIYMYNPGGVVEFYTYRNNEWIKFALGGNAGFGDFIAGADAEEFTLPKGITSIAPYLFYGRNYTTVTIPATVTAIGEYAFYNCPNLTTIKFEGAAALWGKINCRPDWINENANCLVICSDNTVVDLNGIAYGLNSTKDGYTVKGLAAASSMYGVELPLKKPIDAVLLSEIEGIPVTAIARHAFENCLALRSIVIPSSVTTIGSQPFYECFNLKTVNIEANITSIPSYCFYKCYQLTSVTIPEGVTAIGDYAFYNCSKLYQITLPSTLTSISTYSFSNCYALIEIQNLSKLVIEPGKNMAFWAKHVYDANGTSNLITQDDFVFYVDDNIAQLVHYKGTNPLVVLPDDINGRTYELGYACFGYSDIVAITLSAGVTAIESSAWSNCNKLKEIYNLSEVEITNANYNVYTATEGQSYIEVVDGYVYYRDADKYYLMAYIGDETSLVLPDTVNGNSYSLHELCFYGNTQIKSLLLSDNIDNIGTNALNYFGGAQEAIYDNITYYSSVTNPYFALSFPTGAIFDTCEIHPDTKIIMANAFDGLFGGSSITLPDGVRAIGDRAFYDCSNLTEINIPSSVKSIGYYAFYSCSNLATVNITDINAWAAIDMDINEYSTPLRYGTLYLNGATLSGQIELADTITAIGNRAFWKTGITGVTIPESVTKIGAYAFSQCSSLTTANIPSTVQDIGAYAFNNCTSLVTDLIFTDTLKNIGVYAFNNCSKITSVAFPNIVNSLVIGERAFYNCDGITSALLPEGTVEIDDYAFSSCSSLNEISLPSTLETMGINAFSSCSKLNAIYVKDLETWFNLCVKMRSENPLADNSSANIVVYINNEPLAGHVTIPESIGVIGPYAFYKQAVTELSIPSTVIQVMSSAFYSSKIEAVYITDLAAWLNINFMNSNPLQAGANLYLNNELVTNLVLPENITAIPNYAFYGCSSITSIDIPNTITSVGENAFNACYNLTHVTIPSSVTAINDSAFYKCLKLKDVQNLSALTITAGDTAHGYVGYYATNIYGADGTSALVNQDGFIFYAPADQTQAVLMAYEGNLAELTLPSDFNGTPYTLNNYVFYNNDTLTKVTIPEGITVIPAYAFAKCSNLETLELPTSIESIANTAFTNCPKLVINEYGNALYFGNTTNPYYMLYTAIDKTITSAEIHPDTELVLSMAFQDCNKMTSITIGANIKTIKADAFKYCSKLAQIHITDPAAWYNIDFNNEYANPCMYGKLYMNGELLVLSDVVIPEGTTKIGNFAFYKMTGLTSISLPSTIESIGLCAFTGCTGLTRVDIPSLEAWCNIKFNTMSQFGANPLYNGTAELYINNELLTGELTIPESITSIGVGAFMGYKLITSVIIPDHVTELKAGAFYRCSGLTNAVIGNGITTIDADAFNYCSKLATVTLPTALAKIDMHAFANCTALTVIDFPNTLTEIGDEAFTVCSKLTSVTLPGSLQTTGSKAFYNSDALTTVVFEDGIEEIGSYMFDGCAKLSNVTLPTTVKAIRQNAFSSCPVLRSIDLPEGLETLGAYAFSSSPLTSITIPTTIKSIGDRCFYYSSRSSFSVYIQNLAAWCNINFNGDSVIGYATKVYINGEEPTELIIPEGVTKISANAFENNRKTFNVQKIVVPEGVTEIGQSAFYYLTKAQELHLPTTLKKVGSNAFYYYQGDVYIKDIGAWSQIYFENNTASPLYAGIQQLYCNNQLVKDIVLPEGITTIKNYTFSPMIQLNRVTLPSTLKSIGQYAFQNCGNLIEIVNKSSLILTKGSTNHGYVAQYAENIVTNAANGHLTYIDNDYLFYIDESKSIYRLLGYTGTETNLVFPESANGHAYEIYRGAFIYNRRITNVQLAEATSAIGNMAFAVCPNLAGFIAIPAATQTIGYQAFAECTKLDSILIAEGVEQIGDEAFANCKNLVTLDIPSSITACGSGIFRSCPKLTYARIPECATSINVLGCTALERINIPAKVTSIGNNMFKSLTNLKRVDITNLKAWCNITFATADANPLYHGAELYLNNELVTELTIPVEIAAIKNYAFYNCSSLTKVTFPSTTTTIGTYAFYNCAKLTEINLPAVTTINNYAFYNCTNLTTVTFPAVVTINQQAFQNCGFIHITIPSTVTTIGTQAFYNCSKLLEVQNLSSLNIVAGATTYGYVAYYAKHVYGADGESKLATSGDYVFYVDSENNENYLVGYTGNDTELTLPSDINGNKYSLDNKLFMGDNNITKVTIAEGVIDIGNYAFQNCSNLTEVIILNDTTTIGNYAFQNCSNLTDITLPQSVTTIGDHAFYGCSKLADITLPQSVTTIGDHAFYNCCNLTNITLPQSLTTINNNTFYYCYNLVKVTLPENLITIGSNAFYNCYNLMSITIPANVTSIGDKAFYLCDRLVEVQNLSSLTIAAGSTGNGYVGYYAKRVYKTGASKLVTNGDYTFYVDPEATSYLVNYSGNDTELTLPTNINGYKYSLNVNVFKNKTNLTSVNIPGDVTTIGTCAFLGCSNLTNVVLSEGLTSINTDAFYGCKALTSVTIPGSVTTVGSYAFSGCSNLTDLIMSEGVTSIGGREVFKDCTNLTNVTVPSTFTGFNGYDIFNNAKKEKNVYISDLAAWCKITFYSQNVNPLYQNGKLYLNNELVTELRIPEGVTSIYAYAFRGCASITSVILSDSVTSIGAAIFSGCSNLANIIIPESVTTIGGSAFSYCTSLTSIDLPSQLKVLQNYTFKNCTSLTNITIPEGVTSIGSDVFYGCTSLTSITIPEGVTIIDSNAFYGCSALSSVTIPSTVTHVNQDAFRSCTNLEQVHITDLAAWCNIDFYNRFSNPLNNGKAKLYLNGELISGDITIPEGVTTINSYAFSNYTALTSITIPEGVTTISSYAFQDCTSLTDVTIPESVTTVGSYAFRNTGLTSVVIPNTITTLEAGIYYGCTKLKTAIISEGITTISNSMFGQCTSLINVTIPNSVTKINSNAFQGCTSLASIEIPSNVTTIATYVFNGCTALTNITIPDGIAVIYSYAFQGCTSLASIVIPKTVTSVATYAFYNCSKLTDVYYTGTEAEWSAITIGSNNNPLKNATKTYNYVIPTA